MSTKDDDLSFSTNKRLIFNKSDDHFWKNLYNLNLNQNNKRLDENIGPQLHNKLINVNQYGTDFKVHDKQIFNVQSLHQKPFIENPTTCFNAVKKEVKNKWENKKSSGISNNNSTLSLHIFAYENSIENSRGLINKDKQLLKKEIHVTKKWKQISSSISSAFELPRQQQDQNNNPEVMQFKASQQLLNPNEPMGPSREGFNEQQQIERKRRQAAIKAEGHFIESGSDDETPQKRKRRTKSKESENDESDSGRPEETSNLFRYNNEVVNRERNRIKQLFNLNRNDTSTDISRHDTPVADAFDISANHDAFNSLLNEHDVSNMLDFDTPDNDICPSSTSKTKNKKKPKITFESLQLIFFSRYKLTRLYRDKPENFADIIQGCFVLLEGNKETSELAQIVTAIEKCQPYEVEKVLIDVNLKLKVIKNDRIIPLSALTSTVKPTENQFNEWKEKMSEARQPLPLKSFCAEKRKTLNNVYK